LNSYDKRFKKEYDVVFAEIGKLAGMIVEHRLDEWAAFSELITTAKRE